MTSLSQPSKMSITNTTWTPAELLERYNKIKKPKFNRDLVWTIKSTDNTSKRKRANFEEFLQFLFKTRNTVSAISLGAYLYNNEEYHVVIDGNNRINAIVSFFTCPYNVFTSYYRDLFKYIDSILDQKMEGNIKEILKNSIQKLTYRELNTFNRLDDLISEEIEIDRRIMRDIERKIVEIQKKLRFPDNSPYDTHIKLVINEFKNGTNKEYCDTFEDINKYSNTLSHNELLAATLFQVIITIADQHLKCNIIRKIKKYYDDRGNDEVLETYSMELDYNMEISAYDFMVGFQNYCSEEYKIIENFSSDGTSLFFKIFGYIYGSIEKDKFSHENINNFIDKILFACNIICEAYKTIMPVNINDKLFNKTSKNDCSKLLAKNPMTMLFISVIANKDKILSTLIIKKVRLVVIYHLLCNQKYLKNLSEEAIKIIKTHDKLECVAGGSYVDNMCRSIIDHDNQKIFDISKDNFINLLNENLNSSLNEKTYDQERVTNKRRPLNLFDKILVSNFFNKKMSNFYLKEKYSTEHISPYSSVWLESIDINRLGNLFPTLEKINSSRGNSNLDIYYKSHPDFTNFIKELLPGNYNEINNHNGRKTTIVDINKYNEYCSNNEKLYIKTLVDDIFSN
jgi:hypothetical protein